jgi:hypothetical protein
VSQLAVRVILPVLVAAAVLVGVAALGRWARDALRQDFTFAFSAIQCQPPPGPEQADLLAEVQYLAGMPDQVRLLDDDLADRLRAAFARHPWVESVEDVQVAPRRITVQVRYRRPVLAVPVKGQLRAVDGSGILLPESANTRGLPLYPGSAPLPAGPAGTPWGDAKVENTARAAAQSRSDSQ